MRYKDILQYLAEDSAENAHDRIVQKHIDFFGMPVCVEIIAGGVKYSKSFHGEPYERTLKCDYGYFDGFTGSDGDYLDCYIGEQVLEPSCKVFVVKQMRPDGSAFDEHKVFIGFPSQGDAHECFKAHAFTVESDGGITGYTIDEFRKILKTLKD